MVVEVVLILGQLCKLWQNGDGAFYFGGLGRLIFICRGEGMLPFANVGPQSKYQCIGVAFLAKNPLVCAQIAPCSLLVINVLYYGGTY